MHMRIALNYSALRALRHAALLAAMLLAAMLLAAPADARAQDLPGKRLASIVGVAVDEYAKGVDAQGRVTARAEYDEALGFLGDATTVASRLSGGNTAKVRALLDTLAAAMRAKVSPAEVTLIHGRLVVALGRDGVLDLPTRLVSVEQGLALYARNCTACHGAGGLGPGAAAAAFAAPPPPLVGDAIRDVSPATMFRKISVGVAGTAMAGWATSLSGDERWDLVAYIASLRATAAQRERGAALAASRTHALPPEFRSFAHSAERSDAQLARATAEANPALAAADVEAVVAWARALPTHDATSIVSANAPAAGPRDPAAAARAVTALIDDALAAARANRLADAGDQAFDAYLAFEPLETAARMSEPARVTAMEGQFARFKGAVKGGDLEAAQRARDSIVAGLPRIVALSQPATSGWELFLQSFLIILREGFEAILVIGAVIAFLVKTGHQERVRSIWKGVIWALAASVATAVVLATVLSAIPASREIVEGVTMLIAVAVLFSVSYWLVSKVDAARWQHFIRTQVTNALEHGGGTALAFVGFLAVYREGAETALFYQALFRQPGPVTSPLVLGMVAGFAALTLIFILFYRFGVRIPMRPFFGVTSALLYAMAFVFMGKGLRELQEGNAVSLTLLPGWPSVDALGIFPSRETMIGQGIMLALLAFAVVRTLARRREEPAAAPAPAVTRPVGDEVPAHAHVDLEGRVAELSAKATLLQQRLAALEAELEAERARRP